jgi:GxxExxY protein
MEMPIHLPDGLRRLPENEFKQIAYDVMQTVFSIHNEMGCLFDELIYKRAISQRIVASQREVPIEVSFETFRKRYYLDLLVANGAVFEFKTAEWLNDRHRAQSLNYLLIAELPHGKLVNLRGDLVEHEFINAPLSRLDRISFRVDDQGYLANQNGSKDLKELFVSILRDWGTCLDLALYEEVLIHFLGGPQRAIRAIAVSIDGAPLGQQKLILLSPDTSCHVTALKQQTGLYEAQLRRFLKYTPLKAIQWVNVGRKLVTFQTIKV